MKTRKRFTSIFLSMIILISLCSGNVFAAEEDEVFSPAENTEEWIITEMSALDEAVMNQIVPQLVGENEQTKPVLPETMDAMAYQAEEEPQAIQVEGIIWTAAPEYDQKVAGEYIYTPMFPEEYVLA